MVPLLALLELLALSLANPRAGTDTMVIQALPQVSGCPGESVTLLCLLQPLEPNVQVTQVTWMRKDPELGVRRVAVLHPTRGPSLAEPERFQFTHGDMLNASLNVSGLQPKDEANYTCQFATFPRGSRSVVIQLRVLAAPQNSAEAQEVPLRPSTGEPVPVARCISKAGFPPAKVTWFPLLNGSANSTLVLGSQPGPDNVISTLTLVPSSKADGRNVTCRVEHVCLPKPHLLPVTLAVHYPPEVSISGYDGNWHVGQSNVTLNCEARSNPEPTAYSWNTTTGSLPSIAVAQGTQLLIPSVDLSINTTFICGVTNALGTRQKEQTIIVKEVSHWSVPGIVGIVAVVVVVVVLLVIGVICCLKKYICRDCDHSRRLENGDISYSGVAQINDPLDGPTRSTS